VPVPAGESPRHSGSGGRNLKDWRRLKQRPRRRPQSGNSVQPGENALSKPIRSAGRWRKPPPRKALRREPRPGKKRQRIPQSVRPFRRLSGLTRLTPGGPYPDGRYKCRCTRPHRAFSCPAPARVVRCAPVAVPRISDLRFTDRTTGPVSLRCRSEA